MLRRRRLAHERQNMRNNPNSAYRLNSLSNDERWIFKIQCDVFSFVFIRIPHRIQKGKLI